MTNELSLRPFAQRRLTALLMIASVALVAQQHRLARHQANATPLALDALPLCALRAQVLDQIRRVLEAVGVARARAIAARQELVVLPERV